MLFPPFTVLLIYHEITQASEVLKSIGQTEYIFFREFFIKSESWPSIVSISSLTIISIVNNLLKAKGVYGLYLFGEHERSQSLSLSEVRNMKFLERKA